MNPFQIGIVVTAIFFSVFVAVALFQRAKNRNFQQGQVKLTERQIAIAKEKRAKEDAFSHRDFGPNYGKETTAPKKIKSPVNLNKTSDLVKRQDDTAYARTSSSLKDNDDFATNQLNQMAALQIIESSYTPPVYEPAQSIPTPCDTYTRSEPDYSCPTPDYSSPPSSDYGSSSSSSSSFD